MRARAGRGRRASRQGCYGNGLRVEVASRIRSVAADAWDRLLPAEASPFLEHRWLDALERTGCVGESRTWRPAHVLLRDGGTLVAAAPAYVERFGEGDFLGDEEWELFAVTRGVRYLPKLVVGIPFMPVPGPRMLTAPGHDAGELRRALAEALAGAAREVGAQSVHLQLGLPEEVAALRPLGFATRLGCQYHWHRGQDRTFTEFLSRLSSKRRHAVRRELAAIDAQGIRIRTLRGSEVTPERAREAWEMNRDLFHRYGSEPLLTGEMLEEAARVMPDRLELVHATVAGEERPIAAAINASRGARLYGRYWGWRREVELLHFAVCYYHPISECLARGLDVFEPGAGGEHKRIRGFDPTPTWSAHHIAEPSLAGAVRRYVALERTLVARHLRRPDLATEG